MLDLLYSISLPPLLAWATLGLLYIPEDFEGGKEVNKCIKTYVVMAGVPIFWAIELITYLINK